MALISLVETSLERLRKLQAKMMLQRLRDARCRSCWEAFGGLLGPSDASEVPFGTSRGPLGDLLGASWEPLGSLLGASWELLGVPLGCLGPSWVSSGTLGRPRGPYLSDLGALLGALGASWGALGISWKPLGGL